MRLFVSSRKMYGARNSSESYLTRHYEEVRIKSERSKWMLVAIVNANERIASVVSHHVSVRWVDLRFVKYIQEMKRKKIEAEPVVFLCTRFLRLPPSVFLFF